MNTIAYIWLALIAASLMACIWRGTVERPIGGIVPRGPNPDEDM